MLHVVPASDASPKVHSQGSPKHRPTDASPKRASSVDVMDDDESRPSAAELAKKRAERFGIPLIAKKGDEPSHQEEEEEEEKQEQKEDEAMEDTPKEKGPSMEEYRDLVSSALEEGSIIVLADIIGDDRNAKLIQRVIEQSGEEKVKEIIKEVVEKIAKDFDNDRSKIEAPPRLAGFRISRGLKNILPKPERRADKKKTETAHDDKKSDKKDSWKAKWTDEEWAEWSKKKDKEPAADWKKKEPVADWKKKDWGDWKKGGNDWKSNDWNKKGDAGKSWDKKDYGKSWDKKGNDSYEKKRSYSYDQFESDVEEFIYSNRLDKKASKIIREETRGMVTYVMDQGFNLKRFDNPSKEVMLRCKEYMVKKRGEKTSRAPSARGRSPSYSPKDRSRSRSPRGDNRSPPRGRSPSRSNSRDRYRSRSASV